MDLGASGELSECRKCGRALLSRLPACPNCGVRHPTRSYTGGIVMASIATAGLAAWVMMAAVAHPSRLGLDGSVASIAKYMSAPSDSKPAYPPVPASKPAEMTSPPNRLIFITPADAKRVAAPGDSQSRVTNPVLDSEPRVAQAKAAARSVAPLPTGDSAVTPQVVTAWANVREGPSADAAVVKVLRPGAQVDVVQQRGGWWAVYNEGRRVGYVSRSLLAKQSSSPENLSN
jgi:hypothetical protein